MEETIVAEIKINRKSIIYILSYRSPSQSTSEFKKYTEDLDKIYNKALAENPYMIILTGDYNARSPLLWQDEQKQTIEGKALADFCTKNFLHQIIDEPTHLPNETTQTCIDLIMTNQPNFFVDKGVIPSPDPSLKHQIIHGKINLSIPSPPPHKRVVWDYSLAHILAIKNQVANIPWQQIF